MSSKSDDTHSSSKSAEDNTTNIDSSPDPVRSGSPASVDNNVQIATPSAVTPQESKSSDNVDDSDDDNDNDSDDDSDDESVNLPTSIELSKELCKIVDTDNYSRDDSLLALEKMIGWAVTEDSNVLKYFHMYAGVIKVLDFLKTTLDDETCVGSIRWKCIDMAASVICNVCYFGADNSNEDIATEILISAVKYGAIQTLLAANEEYTGGNDTFELKAVGSIWNTLENICNEEAEIEKDQATSIFDLGIDMMAKLSSVHGPLDSKALTHVFGALYCIVFHDLVTKKEFQDKDILSLCLKVFENDDKWSTDDEKLLEEAIGFFETCHDKKLLVKGSDHVKLLPLCVEGLKNFSTNARFREYACNLLDGACSSNINKRNVEKAGGVEALATLLTLDGVEDNEKNKLRKLIGDIMAP